jgi:outer membrane protein TolC
MNVNTSNLRSTALALSLFLAAASAHAQAPAPRPDVAPAPAPSAAAPASDQADVTTGKFDLAAALMAPTGGLTADQAGKKARARAPQILAARATAAGSQTDVDGSWSSFVPIIDLAAQYKHVSLVRNNFRIPGLPEVMGSGAAFTQPQDQWSLTASAQYVVSDVFLRAWPAYKAAVGLADAQKIQIDVAASMVDLTARNAFYDYARALAQRAVDEQALRQAETQAAQIKLFVDAGTSAQVDYMTATASVEERRSQLAVSEGRVAITQHNLATLMGVKSEDIAGISEPVLEPPQQPAASADDLLRTAFDRRAELRALRKLVAANEQVVAAQRGAVFPQLSVNASDLYAKPNARYIPIVDKFRNTWEVGAALSWRPNNTINGTYASRKAETQVAKTRADLGAQEDAIRMEVFNAYQTYTSALTVNAASQARLAAAEEAYRVRLATYKVGAGVIVDLQLADLAVSQARLALANSAIATRAALAALNRAAGIDL